MELNRGEFETEEADLTGEVQEAIYIREEEEGRRKKRSFPRWKWGDWQWLKYGGVGTAQRKVGLYCVSFPCPRSRKHWLEKKK